MDKPDGELDIADVAVVDKAALVGKRPDPKTAEVAVPGGKVVVRPLRRDEILLLRNMDTGNPAKFERKMLAYAMVDPALTEADVAEWQKNSDAMEIEDVSDKIMDISGLRERAEKAAQAIEARFAAKVKPVQGADEAARAKDVEGAQIVFAAGAIGIELLKISHWEHNSTIEAVADVNAQPPLGLEGIEATDKGKQRDGVICFGALGIGGLKLKLHRACIGKLFESSEAVFDAEEIYALAKEMA